MWQFGNLSSVRRCDRQGVQKLPPTPKAAQQPITLDVKQTGEGSVENPHAALYVARPEYPAWPRCRDTLAAGRRVGCLQAGRHATGNFDFTF